MLARVAALAGLIAAAALIAFLMFAGGDRYEVTAVFDNAGQLVKGNVVQVGGRSVGTISDIGLNAATQATDSSTGTELQPLRTSNPVNPEALSAYPRRVATNRSNPYVEPGGKSKLRSGLELFGSYLCPGAGSPTPPVAGPNLSPTLANLIQTFVFAAGAAPECKSQRPLGRLVGQSGLYPRLQQLPLDG